jgi:hypothetical protein
VDQNSSGIDVTDTFQTFEHERVLAAICWLLSGYEDVYSEHVYTLRQYLLHASYLKTGFGVALTTGQWTDLYDGGDGAAYDLCPQWACDAGALQIAFRGGSLTPVPALTYKPYIGLALGGGMEGLAYRSGAPDRTDIGCAKVTRVDYGPPAEDVETVSSDALGMVRAGFYKEAYGYTEELLGDPAETQYNPNRYTYSINGASAGAMYRRQVVLLSVSLASLLARGGALYIDPFGVHYWFYGDDGKVLLRKMAGTQGSWSTPALVSEAGTDARDFSLFWQGGRLFLRWTSDTSTAHRATSTNMEDFTGEAEDVALKYLRSCAHYGTEYVAGFDAAAGKWYCTKRTTGNGTALLFLNGTTQMEIGPGDDHEAGFWGNAAGDIFLNALVGDGLTRYTSRDGGSTWEAKAFT